MRQRGNIIESLKQNPQVYDVLLTDETNLIFVILNKKK